MKHKVLLLVLGGILVIGYGRCSAVSARKEQARKQQQQLERYRKAISEVLLTDHNISLKVTREICVERYEGIVKHMAAIDLSACPEKFANAYRKHMDDWTLTLPWVDKVAKFKGWGNFAENCVVGFLAGFTGEWDVLDDKAASDRRVAEKLKEEGRRVNDKIGVSYEEVLRVAESYGVDTSLYRAKQ